FGGHPVSCAAGLAAAQVLEEEQLISGIKQKEALFLSLLQHPLIKTIRSAGLLMAVEFADAATSLKVVEACLHNGLFTDWFLFAPQCLRIAPPLCITEEEIRLACALVLKSCNDVQ
ncbi:MAG: aminotransferase class III-fold pyridoxal phosphate-dependent enzyme, partial [Dinghuibacter sp.]|nr:aminotransferase class III-fold pyridoxal phosphate-dependent enzyme [Dinghuibacter sp.]